jgi:hypothetical protein
MKKITNGWKIKNAKTAILELAKTLEVTGLKAIRTGYKIYEIPEQLPEKPTIVAAATGDGNGYEVYPDCIHLMPDGALRIASFWSIKGFIKPKIIKMIAKKAKITRRNIMTKYYSRPEWAKYRAWDKDGLGTWFAEKPQICHQTNEWISAGKQEYCAVKAPEVPWIKSLEALV